MLTCEQILARAAELARGRPITQSNDVRIASQILDKPRDYAATPAQEDTSGFEDLPEVREKQRAASWDRQIGHVWFVLNAVATWQQYAAIQRAKQERQASPVPNASLGLSYAAAIWQGDDFDPPDPVCNNYPAMPRAIHAETIGAAALRDAFHKAGQRWWKAVAAALATVGYTESTISVVAREAGGSGEIVAVFRRPGQQRDIIAWLTTAVVVPPILRWGSYMHRHLPGATTPLRVDEDGMCAIREDLVCVRARWRKLSSDSENPGEEGNNVFLPVLHSLGIAEALLREVTHELDMADQIATLAEQATQTPSPEPVPAQDADLVAVEVTPPPTKRARKGAASPPPVASPPEPAPPEPAPKRRRARTSGTADTPPPPDTSPRRKPIPPPVNPAAPAPPPPTKTDKRKPEPPPDGQKVVQTRLL